MSETDTPANPAKPHVKDTRKTQQATTAWAAVKEAPSNATLGSQIMENDGYGRPVLTL